MSRHRNFRNMNYDDERDDEDDEEFHRYSISMDDDSMPMSPNTAKFMYHRPRMTSSSSSSNTAAAANASLGDNNVTRISDFIVQEEENSLENDVIFDIDTDNITDNKDNGAQFHMDIQREQIAPSDAIVDTPKKVVPPPPSGKDEQQQQRLKIPEVENLRLSETSEKSSKSNTLTPNASFRRLNALAAAQATPAATPKVRHRNKEQKPLINLVIVGHVDAGKSTLMGHLLYQMGCVDDRTMHKYKKESARTGKASFAFAWVLDDTQEERERGVTMDIAKTTFETENRRIVLLDAPGHKDFIPNMITGASQADAGLLVVNATTGEFETGFDLGGQTREHAMLLRSLGITELSIAVNKMDTVDWSKKRYDEVCDVLKTFLRKQAGFPKIRFVPVSGLDGINLTKPPPQNHSLVDWYTGPTLLQFIDEISIPIRPEECALRGVINDVCKITQNSVMLSVKIESGHTECGERLFIMPNADPTVVKGVEMDSSAGAVCFAGDHCLLTLQALNTFEPDSISCGQVLCRGGKECLVPTKRFLVRLVVFNIMVPLMKGTKAELFAHSLCEPCVIVRLRSTLNKASGQVLKHKPRCLARNMSGTVEIQTERAIAVEPYSQCKALGRVTLRSGGQTIAAGIIEQILE